MRAAIARLLVVIASIVVWFGLPYSLLMPVVSGYFATESDEPLLTYTYIFLGMWFAFFVVDFLVRCVAIPFFQYIFLGSVRRSELILEAKLDRPEVQEMLESGEWTRVTLGEQLHKELKEARPGQRIAAYGFTVLIYVLGFIVVWFITKT